MSDENLRVEVARMDERAKSNERRISRLEMAVLAVLIAIASVVGKALFASIGLPT